MSFFGGLGGFWNNFTGQTQADDIRKGTEAANGYLKQGNEQAEALRTQGYNKAITYYDPRIKAGQDAENVYRTAVGLNGRDQQADYYKNFQFDPGLEAQLNAGIRATDRSAASRGMLRSGQNLNAIADTGRQWANKAYNDRLNQYGQMFTRGDQASNLAAATTSDHYNALGDMRSGMYQQFAGNTINQQNAIANTRNVGLQNTLNILGTAAKFFGGGGNNTWTTFGSPQYGTQGNNQNQGYNYYGGPR